MKGGQGWGWEDDSVDKHLAYRHQNQSSGPQNSHTGQVGVAVTCNCSIWGVKTRSPRTSCLGRLDITGKLWVQQEPLDSVIRE